MDVAPGPRKPGRQETTMNKPCSILFFVMLASGVHAEQPGKVPLNVVPKVDLPRYMGTWYEVARLPFKFQNQCVSDVTATYTLRVDGRIAVVNRCRTKDGSISEAKGIAKQARADGPNTKLKVRFAPSWLSVLPFVWGDYWITVLAPDYSYAAIGEPGRKYLWILSRTPTMDEPTLRHILDQLEENGYDLTRLIRTPASPSSAVGATRHSRMAF